MINGIGVVGWGVGGIEAEAGMLGQPVYFLTPDVVGVHLTGQAARRRDRHRPRAHRHRDAAQGQGRRQVRRVLRRRHRQSLAVPDRATIANMAPEYGATMGFFPVDDDDHRLLRGHRPHRRTRSTRFEAYFKAQGMFGIPKKGDDRLQPRCVELDLGTVTPSLAGPKRPQDRIELGKREEQVHRALLRSRSPSNGFAQEARGPRASASRPSDGIDIGSGDVLIAAITSCTNTSNPSVLLAAGLLAKKAVEHGLTVKPHVKTSLAPGSRVVTEYLTSAGLLPYLEKLGFYLAGYGCTTCIGNAGPLRRAHRGSDRRERPRLRGGALGQPQLRGAHPSEHARQLPRLAAAGGGLRDRRHGAEGPR